MTNAYSWFHLTRQMDWGWSLCEQNRRGVRCRRAHSLAGKTDFKRGTPELWWVWNRELGEHLALGLNWVKNPGKPAWGGDASASEVWMGSKPLCVCWRMGSILVRKKNICNGLIWRFVRESLLWLNSEIQELEMARGELGEKSSGQLQLQVEHFLSKVLGTRSVMDLRFFLMFELFAQYPTWASQVRKFKIQNAPVRISFKCHDDTQKDFILWAFQILDFQIWDAQAVFKWTDWGGQLCV